MEMRKNYRKSEEGTLLLIAIIILGIALAISASMSLLIIKEKNFSSNFVNSQKAYYAAASGIEVNLLEYKLNSHAPEWQFDSQPPPPLQDPSWHVDIDEASFEYELSKDESMQTTFTEVDNVNIIGWEVYEPIGPEQPWLEYHLTSWPQIADFDIEDASVLEGLCDTACIDDGGNPSFQIPISDIANFSDNHTLRIKPLKTGASFSLEFDPEVGAPTGDVTIVSTGNYNDKYKKAIEVTIGQGKVRGIFDYVLFADEYNPAS